MPSGPTAQPAASSTDFALSGSLTSSALRSTQPGVFAASGPVATAKFSFNAVSTTSCGMTASEIASRTAGSLIRGGPR